MVSFAVFQEPATNYTEKEVEQDIGGSSGNNVDDKRKNGECKKYGSAAESIKSAESFNWIIIATSIP